MEGDEQLKVKLMTFQMLFQQGGVTRILISVLPGRKTNPSVRDSGGKKYKLGEISKISQCCLNKSDIYYFKIHTYMIDISENLHF